MGRPRREDARDTRGLILQVTVELLADRGVSGMAVSDIAERLGVTKAAVFYHFPTKEAILEALVTPSLERLNAFMDENPPSGRTSESLIRGLIDTMTAPASPSLGFAILIEPAFGPGSSLGAAIGAAKLRITNYFSPDGSSPYRELRAWAAIGAVDAIAKKLAKQGARPSLEQWNDIREVMVATALGALGD